MPESERPTRWHRLLAALLELLLTPFGITVQSEVQVMSEPPRVDLLLLRREGDRWNQAQSRLLPDGIRQSSAREILIESKLSESVDEDGLQQGQGYDRFYRQTQRRKPDEVQTFLLTAITPRKRFFEQSGYRKSEIPGIYVHDLLGLRRLPLIVINELSDEPHNAFVQCFASRRRIRERAYRHMQNVEWDELSEELWEFMIGLQNQMRKQGESMLKESINQEITPESVKQIGKKMRQALLATMTPEERLAGLAPEAIQQIDKGMRQALLSTMTPEERMAGLGPEAIQQIDKGMRQALLSTMTPEERMAGLTPELFKQVDPQTRHSLLETFAPEDRLAGLGPEERLAGLTPEEIASLVARLEEWLHQQSPKQ